MKIATTHVQSSNINRIGYNATTLFIGFNSGESYSYAGVPYWVYLDMLSAESVGKFFFSKIKGKFAYTHLAEDPFDASALEAQAAQ